MKILCISYEYPLIGGGAAPVVKAIAEVLAARGHQVTVVTMGYRDRPAYEAGQGMEFSLLINTHIVVYS